MIRGPGIAALIGASLAAALLCTTAAAATIHFRVDPNATQIVASVKEPLARIRGAASGTFNVIDGTIEGDPANPVQGGRIAITFDATSYKSGSAYRDKRVTRDALDAEHFPVIKFVSTRIEDFKWVSRNVEATATVVGDLTLHGVTREVRIPIDATLSPDKKLLQHRRRLRFHDERLRHRAAEHLVRSAADGTQGGPQFPRGGGPGGPGDRDPDAKMIASEGGGLLSNARDSPKCIA